MKMLSQKKVQLTDQRNGLKDPLKRRNWLNPPDFPAAGKSYLEMYGVAKPRKKRHSLKPKDEWKNEYISIFKAELPDQYEKKLELQNKIFQKAHSDRSPLTDFAINLIEDKFKPSAGLVALRLHSKLKYPHCVGAAGFAVVQDNNLMPENDFFTPGKIFEVRVVHSNFPDSSDDAAPGVRCLGFKLSDHDTVSPLDLLCYTGQISPFYNYQSMLDYIYATGADENAYREYLLKCPVNLQAHIEGIRHLPESYHNLHYYPQLTYDFVGKDGIERVVRFRIIPTDGRTDSSRLSKEQQRAVWNLTRSLEETRPMDYLKTEYSDRLFEGPIDYFLQFQLHTTKGKQCHSMYNNSIAWEESLHPWTTLMRISLTRQLPDDVTQVMAFHVTNLPDIFRIPQPNSVHDFNVVGTILSDACSMYIAAQPQEVSDIQDGDVTEYIVHLVLGGESSKGSMEVEVSIAFIGLDGCTRYRKLSPRNPTDFSTKSKNTFTFIDRPVGPFQCAKLYVKCGSNEDIYIDYLIVATPYDGRCYTLLCHKWMGTQSVLTVLTEALETSPFKRSTFIQLQHLLELQDQRTIYQWAKEPLESKMSELPGHMQINDLSNLPRDLKFPGFKEMVTEWETLCRKDSKGKSLFGAMVSFLRTRRPLEHYEDMVTSLLPKYPGIKSALGDWRNQSDEAFVRQVVYGPNPMKITRLSHIPENFMLPEDVSSLLTPGRTLQQELLDGKLFMIAYPELSEYAAASWEDQNKYLCAPMCLFGVRFGKLVPLAIQLTHSPTNDTPVYTPYNKKGEVSEWQLAKCWVRTCDLQLHMLSVFLLGSYLLMEPITVAVARNLPPGHAIYRLLWPHVCHLPVVNAIYRQFLYGEDGLLKKVLHSGSAENEHLDFMVKQYKKFQWPLLCLPNNIHDRGLHQLPDYDYRDAGLKLWDAIHNYVSDVIHVCYPRDDDVARDTELHNFLSDLTENGYHDNCNLPRNFDDCLELISFCTAIVWRILGQRSVVTRDLVNNYSIIPSSPPFMRVPPPQTRRLQGWTEEEYCAMLPPVGKSQQFIKMCHLLESCNSNAPPLLKMPNSYWTDPRTRDAFQRFQIALSDLQVAMDTQNELSDVINTSLHPQNITASCV